MVYVLGMIGEDGKSHLDLDDIRRDYEAWDKEIISKGFVFEDQDDGGFYYRHPEKNWTVWIRTLYIPD